MNLINYNVELNNINLTPFKYIMCALIHKFSFKSNYPIDASFPPFDPHSLITFEAIDSLISEKNALVIELERYKRSLIFEAVTGKRNVV